jgi:hypothetical protein
MNNWKSAKGEQVSVLLSNDNACVLRNSEQALNMGSNHSDLWIKAIKEVLAEDGKPPLTANEENEARVDIEKMNASRDNHLARIDRSTE